MSGAESYGAFAYAYDEALGKRFFKAVRRLLDDVLRRHPAPARTHLDLACGTGLALEHFARLGYASVGIDASLPMLRLARPRAQRLVAGDLRALPLRRRFARVTCLYDSLNHLRLRSDLVVAFRGVARVLDRGGLFLFDMNHPDVYPKVWGMKQPFVASGSDYHLEIATRFTRRDALGHALVTGWARLPTGERVDIRERHEQRAWSEREIAESLSDAGLTIVERLDFDPFDERESLDAAGVKIFYAVA
jgi:SAM-dependent methyltransferase